MIPKYKKSGSLKLVFGFGLLFLSFVVLALTAKTDARKLGEFIGIVVGLVGYLIFAYGCSDLLKARGYDSSMALAFIIPVLCCGPIFIFIAPIVIFFGLKDKTKRRR